LIQAFASNHQIFQIEADTSSGSYFYAFGLLTKQHVVVNNWPKTSFQIDSNFPAVFGELMDSPINGASDTVSRKTQLGDSIMTAITLSPLILQFSEDNIRLVFTDLGRLRLQECERVFALKTQLTKCGGKVLEENDTLTVSPSKLHGAEIETYNDHRMAMCFAVLGLKVPGIKLKNPACVKKTFPNFFQKLAAPPPSGLGATILDGKTGRKLTEAELFAE